MTKPRTPQTNGRVERFNGRISDILKTHHFLCGEDLTETLQRYDFLYNNQLPQSALGSQTPAQTMQKWFILNSEPFIENRTIDWDVTVRRREEKIGIRPE